MSNPSTPSHGAPPPSGNKIIAAVKTAARFARDTVHSPDGKWADVHHYWSHDFPHRIEHAHNALRDTMSGIPGGSGLANPLIAQLDSRMIVAGSPTMMDDYEAIFAIAVANYPWHVFGDQAMTRQHDAEIFHQNIVNGIATPANAGAFNTFLRQLQGGLQTHGRITTNHDQIHTLQHARDELVQNLNIILRDRIWNGNPAWAATVNPTAQQVRMHAQEALTLVNAGFDFTNPARAIVYRPDQILRAVNTVHQSLNQSTSSMPHTRAELPKNAQGIPWENPERREHDFAKQVLGGSAERQREYTRRAALTLLGSGIAYVGSGIDFSGSGEGGGKESVDTEENLFEGKPFELRAQRKGNKVYIKLGADVSMENCTIVLSKTKMRDWKEVRGTPYKDGGYFVADIPAEILQEPGVEIDIQAAIRDSANVDHYCPVKTLPSK